MDFSKQTFSAIIYGSPGMGKALENNTGVLTDNGFKPIKDVVAGDRVYGEDGMAHTVLGVYPQGVRPTYNVRFNDGAVVRCDEDHIWTVCATSGNSAKAGWRNLTTKELIDRGIYHDFGDSRKASGRKPSSRWKVPVANAISFDEQDFIISPYLMGVFLGDGCTSGGKPIFVNPEMDKEIMERVAAELPEGYSMSARTINIPAYYVKSDSRENLIAKTIREYGIDTVAAKKHIPEAYLHGSVQQRLDLLRGLMDTDGSSHRNRICFDTTSPRLADDVIALVQSLGGIARMHVYDRTREGKSIEYRVSIRLNYCPFYLKRKAAEWQPRRR